jgi:septum formation protein
MSEQSGIRLVLGSGSPRRAQLLRQLRIEFEQVVSSAAEPAPTDDDPGQQAIRCAQIKARAVHELLGPTAQAPAIVVGADTMVVVDGTMLGKPADTKGAQAMLRMLSGRSHTVCTGICLLGPGELEQTDCVFTEVWIKPLSAEDIETYVASGEPMDKAGAYAIQGLGARFVERINGCYYNVVGLPLARLTAMLKEAGYS